MNEQKPKIEVHQSMAVQLPEGEDGDQLLRERVAEKLADAAVIKNAKSVLIVLVCDEGMHVMLSGHPMALGASLERGFAMAQQQFLSLLADSGAVAEQSRNGAPIQES